MLAVTSEVKHVVRVTMLMSTCLPSSEGGNKNTEALWMVPHLVSYWPVEKTGRAVVKTRSLIACPAATARARC